MRSSLFASCATALLACAAAAQAPPLSSGEEAFARLQRLEGSWLGTYEWSGVRTGGGTARAEFRPTGNGSALVEDLRMGEAVSATMTSVYHLDGAELRLTHYCAAGNQPRLVANRFAEGGAEVGFAFVDGTNLAARPSRVDAVAVRFLATDHLEIRFTFVSEQGESVERIELRRLPAGAG